MGVDGAVSHAGLAETVSVATVIGRFADRNKCRWNDESQARTGSAGTESNLGAAALRRSAQIMRNGNNLQKPLIAGFLEFGTISG
ncbi:hypothetical protein SS05631_b64290 (plasmid) [Sinorhizobium sp. CCBAU 05631]|nr:hypothetical protein SS05631_b64290 [Sinorhizobium sp. CCBAU 05631]